MKRMHIRLARKIVAGYRKERRYSVGVYLVALKRLGKAIIELEEGT